jgi:hypothetical protein
LIRQLLCGTPNIANTSYKGNRGYHYYLDGLKVNGKRKGLFFKKKRGEDALAISQELRILAAKCAKSLERFGKSIWDATEFYVEHLERMRGSVPVSVLFTDYLETKQRAKLSEKRLPQNPKNALARLSRRLCSIKAARSA